MFLWPFNISDEGPFTRMSSVQYERDILKWNYF